MAIRLTVDACVEGNPLKAWHGTTGPDDEEHVPDDVWEEREFSFASLDEAAVFVSKLPTQTTTHVKLFATDEEGEYLLWERDAAGDLVHEDGTHDLVEERPQPEPTPEEAAAAAIPEAPPLMEGL